MHKLSYTTGPVGYGEPSGEDGDPSEALTGQAFYNDLIDRANSVPITLIFKHYKIFLSAYSRKTVCPFLSHKGGRENSASFYYYAETNTYHCFGCKTGSFAVDFVSIMDRSTKNEAAHKILQLFGTNIGAYNNDGLSKEDSTKQLEIMLSFSNIIREFHQSFPQDKDMEYIEKVCSVYDEIISRHKKINNESLSNLIDKLKEEISLYNE